MKESSVFPWEEIRARYLTGETAAAIAASYPGLDEKKIYNRAYKGKWAQERQAIRQETTEQVKAQLAYTVKTNVDLATRAVGKILQDYLDAKEKDASTSTTDTRLLLAALRLAYPRRPEDTGGNQPAPDDEVSGMSDQQLMDEIEKLLE